MSDMYKELEAQIMAEMAAQAEAELGYVPPADTFKSGSVIKPGDDPFVAMDLPQARVRSFKMELRHCIAAAIRDQELSQRRVASLSKLAQSDVSKLMQGQVSGFTIDRLLEVFIAVGGELEGKARVPHTKIPKGKPVPMGSARLVTA